MVFGQDEDTVTPWYESWFDSPYYPLLYSDRDEEEAEAFLQRLLHLLRPAPGSRMLDLACGKGRYSRYLATQGYQVVGLDLSANSIAAARRYEHSGLSFYQHDMRNLFRVNYFDYIFNFFTSFGYFKRFEDNIDVLANVYKGLKPGGVFVIDYLNSGFVRKHIVAASTKVVKGIRFDMKRRITEDEVVKDIRFSAEGKDWFFQERVRLFTMEQLSDMIKNVGFSIGSIYGSYRLDPYQSDDSERMIIIAQKESHAGDDYWMGRTDVLLD